MPICNGIELEFVNYYVICLTLKVNLKTQDGYLRFYSKHRLYSISFIIEGSCYIWTNLINPKQTRRCRKRDHMRICSPNTVSAMAI